MKRHRNLLAWSMVAIFASPWGAVAEEGEVITPLSDNPAPSANLTLDQQIQMIDVEILLLKAELAQKNLQVSQVGVYLSELKALLPIESLSSQMQDRVARLQAYYDSAQLTTLPSTTGFRFNARKMLALLPMTGPYSQAGQAVYQGLQDAFHDMPMPYDLDVLDTNIYDSMFEAWEWVRLYQPSFIFGPLQKAHVAELKNLDLHTPVLAFNELQETETRDALRALAPSSMADSVTSLVRYLQNSHARRIVVLTDGDDKSEALVKRFKETLAPEDDSAFPVKIVEVTKIESHVDEALERALHAQQSQGRKGWLQHTIAHSLVFEERPRQDVDVVVSFLPYRLAMQVSPLLEYYHLNALAHYWLPSDLPPADQLMTSLPYWQSTSAILPSYYAAQVQKKQSSTAADSGVGIFYALGQLAAKAVVNLTQENVHVMRSELGDLSVDSEQHFHFYPDVYWLDTGVFERLTP